MNVLLIGMPGCGKSTLGVLLAKCLGYDFIDCDLVFQKQTGTLLQDYLDREGLDAFLKEEERVLLTLADSSGAVLATGGSAVYSEAAMHALLNSSVCLHLDVSLEALKKRLSNLATRGVAMEKDTTIEELYAERAPLYRRFATVTLDVSELEVEPAVSAALALLKPLL